MRISFALFGSSVDGRGCVVAVWHLEVRPDLGMEGRWQQSLGHICWNLTSSFPCVRDVFQAYHSRGLKFFSSRDCF